MAPSSPDGSSYSRNDDSSSGSNTSDEEFVLREKKVEQKIGGNDKAHMSKSHSVGRRYRKQESSSDSSDHEVKPKRYKSISSVIVKQKSDSSLNEKEHFHRNDQFNNRKINGDWDSNSNPLLHQIGEQGKKSRSSIEYSKHKEGESKWKQDRHKNYKSRAHLKEEDFSGNYECERKYSNRSKIQIKDESVSEDYANQHRQKGDKVPFKKERIEEEYDSENGSQTYSRSKNRAKDRNDHDKNFKQNNFQVECPKNRKHKRDNVEGEVNVDQTEVPNKETPEKEMENYELSGKLTEYTNTYNGVVIIYNEPPEARKPKTRWRFYPFKGEKALTMLQLHRQSAFLLGRDRKVADIPVDHPSCSKQHAVLQFRLVPYEKDDGEVGKKVKPYIIDLDSRNGTHVNNKKIDPRKYVELLERDVVKFGFSSRDYVLLHEKSEDVDSAEDEGEN